MPGMLGIGTTAVGGIYNEIGNARQNRQQREMMGLQYGNQRKLNQQGHRMQMDMWNKTNYGAQVDHMKEAGLNPALMYGSAGQGGQTGSQGGGSAGSGAAPKAPVMDMSNMLMDAQMRNINKDTEVKEANRRNIEGETPLGEALVTESGVRSALGESNISVNEEQVNQIKANVDKLNADASLTRKIEEMNYGGEFGTNMTQNIIDIVGGKLDLSTYIGLASGIAGLTVLRSSKVVSKLGTKGMTAVSGAIKSLKNKLMGKKKGKDVTKAFIDKLNNAKNLKN